MQSGGCVCDACSISVMHDDVEACGIWGHTLRRSAHYLRMTPQVFNDTHSRYYAWLPDVGFRLSAFGSRISAFMIVIYDTIPVPFMIRICDSTPSLGFEFRVSGFGDLILEFVSVSELSCRVPRSLARLDRPLFEHIT